MVRLSRIYAVVLLIALSFTVVFQTACEKSKIREARKAAHRIQVVTDAAIDTTTALYRENVITREQTHRIALALLDVNKANRVLIEKAAAATEDTPEVRRDLLATLSVITDAVRQLKDAGVLHIKNQNSQLVFESTLSALDTSIAAVQAALAGGR